MRAMFILAKCAYILVVLSVVGCATAVKERVVFPPPPEVARFEWLGTFSSADNFQKGGVAGFVKSMSGDSGKKAFKGPIGLTAHVDGRVLVSDLYSQSVKTFNIDKQEITDFTTYAFRNNFGIDSDDQGIVYVADGKARQVLVFSPDGTALRTIGGKDLLVKPVYLAVNNQLGRLYVSDALDHNVKVFTLAGEFLFTFGEKGVAPGQLYVPQGIAINPAGQLFVADSLNARISVFSAEGEFLRTFGARGTFGHQLESPKDLAFDSDGNLYLIDARRPNFRVFTPEGDLLLVIGGDEPTTHLLGFKFPSSICIDRSDRVFVSDLLSGRITVWQYFSEAFLKRAAGP